MNSAQIVKHLGLSYKVAEGPIEGSATQSVLAVMSAPVPFFAYNPSILCAPEAVQDYLMEAKAVDGQYQLSLSYYDGPLAVDDYSKLVILTAEEALLFKGIFDKYVRLYERVSAMGAAYDELADEFDALKASFKSRAALYEPEGLEALAAA
ncbi:hypothetical protein [Paraburkholderia sp. A3RO-2L]|uniref:hypothetical protein n=1 Tax=Paraburkholderia sp. A3RO-2L TaxID=3028376 RepID=UPI0032F5286F|nr:hypothetical protein [Burkholderia vietnamiensis]